MNKLNRSRHHKPVTSYEDARKVREAAEAKTILVAPDLGKSST